MAGPSWLGGPAAGITLDEWPRRTDGTPLAHVATFHLQAADQLDLPEQADWPILKDGLPTEGVLQIFHDLTLTYGYDPEDALSGGWLVQWLPDPSLDYLTDGPDNLDLPSSVCQVIDPLATFSIPASSDVMGATDRAFAAAEQANEEFQRAWSFQRTQDPQAIPLPVTHLYGHSQAGDQLPLHEILPRCLPLEIPGDEYRLIADIESWTTLEGWFGDASPLEVWMRKNDLEARAFDRAWCIVRTD
ncbi:DUF1963 domain-containing protein [Frondihabitans sp. 4ASC-45]|uniref:DUF1963 domain-containing protein n=1 Tax=Frondihabitans sp. 4ASC-45 TaxID=3111636 RepID=UPI003C17805F